MLEQEGVEMDAERQGTERRRHERYTLIAQVHVKRAREDIVMELINISLSGALVDMGDVARPGWLEVGRDLNLSITNPVTSALVELTGKVRRIVEEERHLEFGVEFGEADDETAKAVTELLAVAMESIHPDAPPRPPPLPSARSNSA